jgi:hypothetical protein
VHQHSGLAGDERGEAGPGPVGRQRWRTILAVLLIVVGCVLAPLAGVAVWACNQVTNIDRYVRTGSPAGQRPGYLAGHRRPGQYPGLHLSDVRGLTNQAVDALAERAWALGGRPAPRVRGAAR